MRYLLGTTPIVAGILLLAASEARAQSAPGVPQEVKQPDANSVSEIVVTAQRRQERAIDVPQTVNLVTADKLEKAGITDAQSLNQVVPSLYITPNGLSVQPTIRGVGSSITTAGASGTVAAYIDGIYQLAQGTYNFDLSNVDNIQVLKGPQGTLYGRNATGGVILITTTPPSFTFGGKATAGYGNYNDRTFSGYVTGGLTDHLAGNLAVDYRANDGYFYDIYRKHDLGAVEQYTVRGKLLYDFGSGNKVTVGYTHSYDSDPNTFETAPLNGNTVAKLTPGTVIATKPFDVALTFDPFVKNVYDQFSLNAEFGNDLVRANLITGANFNTEKIFADADFSPLPTTFAIQTVKEKVFSQEATFSSAGEHALSWIGGLSYVRSQGDYDPYISTFASIINTSVTNDSYSAFLELTYKLTNKLSIVGGARYTQENLKYTGAKNGIAAANASMTNDKWTPRFSVNYKLTDDSSLYATYSQGFRSGGWNQSILSNTPYQPEYVTAYEVGAKSSMLNHRLTLNAAVYDYDYSNIQFSAATISAAGVSSTTILNAAAATIYGAELSADYRVSSDFSLNAGFGYTHGVYDSFPNALITTPKLGTFGNNQFVANVSGKNTIRTPDYTANLGANYTLHVPYGALTLSGNANYTGVIYREPSNRIKSAPYTLLNARATYRMAGKPWEFALWAKNITDEHYAAYTTDSTLGDRIDYAPPATYGFTVSRKF